MSSWEETEHIGLTQPNRGGWGQILTLSPDNASSTTVDASVETTCVISVQPLDLVAATLVLEQTRSMIQWRSARLTVPVWGLALELPSGYVRASLRALGPIVAPVRFAAGIARGLAQRSWFADPASPLKQPQGTQQILAPLAYSRRVEVAVQEGTLLDALGTQWLTQGQSQIITAQNLLIRAKGGIDALVSIAWEIVS